MEGFFDGDARKASRYLEKFERLLKSECNDLILMGDNILVERLPPLELKTKSGIIIADAKTHRETSHDAATEFGVVLMTGPGQVMEDGSVLPCESLPGLVVLLPGNVTWYSQFGHIAGYEPYSIGRLRDSQVPMWFCNYKRVFEILNG